MMHSLPADREHFGLPDLRRRLGAQNRLHHLLLLDCPRPLRGRVPLKELLRVENRSGSGMFLACWGRLDGGRLRVVEAQGGLVVVDRLYHGL